MVQDVLVSLAGYLTVYMFGGFIGFGTAAVCAVVGKSDLMAENARLRRQMAEASGQRVVPFESRGGKERLRLIGEH
ncbi:MAG TPA: hypothetical protein VLA00_07050 [Xanthobacteraceae bacterium]|nr:hypothetical protein [Xanthobacteraceae bacterium]